MCANKEQNGFGTSPAEHLKTDPALGLYLQLSWFLISPMFAAFWILERLRRQEEQEESHRNAITRAAPFCVYWCLSRCLAVNQLCRMGDSSSSKVSILHACNGARYVPPYTNRH